jgi:hypothetical protein
MSRYGKIDFRPNSGDQVDHISANCRQSDIVPFLKRDERAKSRTIDETPVNRNLFELLKCASWDSNPKSPTNTFNNLALRLSFSVTPNPG